MKKIYALVILCCISLSTYVQSQNILGEWYVYSVYYEDIEYLNIYSPNEYGTIFNINITDQQFNGDAICNGYGGIYSLQNNNIFSISEYNFTLAYCNSTDENSFEFYYSSIFTTEQYPNTTDLEITISYVGPLFNEEILTLTNTNGNFVTYGRHPPIENVLSGEWFLHGISNYNSPALGNPNEIISINFSPTTDSGYNNLVINGICNSYESDYLLPILDNSFKITIPNWTPESCIEDEDNYDFALSELFTDHNDNYTDPIPISYTITGTGNESILEISQVFYRPHNIESYHATFGRQTLSTNQFNQLNFSVFPNPTNGILNIKGLSNFENISYSILDIHGRLIQKEKIQSKNISVSNLKSGVYFLQLKDNQNKKKKILKFIKL